MEKMEIRCPHCSWKPDGGAHWSCTCGTVWNTFDTAGVCPGCNKKWEATQCPDGFCLEWSQHEDWYVIPVDFEALFNSETKRSSG